jgi:FkbM family methyltransferase
VSGSGLKKSNDPSVFITRDTVKFLLHESGFRQIFDIPEYRFDDLYPTDRVIDIGANVGAFCIRASRYSHHVVAIEPLTATLLRENIRLNGVSVQVIEGALGDGKPKTVWWDDNKVFSQTYPLHNIIEMAGGCDFLKCDCEGAEWSIEPKDLEGIRRIEMELHLPPISGPPNPVLLDYISRHYHFEIEQKPIQTTLGVMGVLHAERKT